MANEFNLELACRQIFGISSMRYRQLVKERGAPPVYKGQVDILLASKFLIDYYRKLSEGQGSLGLTEERTRLVSYEAEIRKMELKRLQGSLIEADLVEQALKDVFYLVKSKLDSAPVRIASEVAYLLKDAKDINIVKTKAQSIIKDIEKELSDVKTYRNIVSNQKSNKDIPAEAEFDD